MLLLPGCQAPSIQGCINLSSFKSKYTFIRAQAGEAERERVRVNTHRITVQRTVRWAGERVERESHFNCLGLEIKYITLKKWSTLLNGFMHSQMRTPHAAWNMYQPEIWVSLRIIISSVDRAVKTKSNSTATRRHKVSLGRYWLHPGGRSELCSRGTKFMQTRHSCHCNINCESPAASC